MSYGRESFHAYYYTLESTENVEVDAILKALARAGKNAHNTQDWSENDVEAIQAAAQIAADEMKRLRATIARLKTWRDEQGGAESWGVGRGVATVLTMYDLALEPPTTGEKR